MCQLAWVVQNQDQLEGLACVDSFDRFNKHSRYPSQPFFTLKTYCSQEQADLLAEVLGSSLRLWSCEDDTCPTKPLWEKIRI